MNTPARLTLVAILLLFSWKGVNVEYPWPPQDVAETLVEKPDAEDIKWASAVRQIAAGMLPADRIYLSSLYEAMRFVISRDAGRSDPILKTTDDFVAFHSSALRLAIDKKKVGKYPGLDAAIDTVFLNAVGADQRAVDADAYDGLMRACGVLAWTFGMGNDG